MMSNSFCFSMLYCIGLDSWVASFGRSLSASEADSQLPALFKESFGKMSQLEMGNGRFEQVNIIYLMGDVSIFVITSAINL